MKTKLLSFLLTLAMVTPILAGCGNETAIETDADAGVETPKQGESETDTESQTPMPDETEAPETEEPKKPPETLVLVTEGVSEYVIVRSENATDNEILASTELQSYLKQISGAELSIVTDSTEPTDKEIIIGQTNRETDGQFDRDELGRDGFVILADSGKLWLVGGEWGTLYAVYELLESYMGCRFYTADFEKVPETTTVSVEIGKDKQIPQIENRNIYWADILQNPTLQNKLKIKIGTWAGGSCHTLPYLAETGDGYGPDPCLLKEESYDTVLKNVRALLAENPNADYISVSQADGKAHCPCRDCKASAKEHGWSGHYLMFVNRIAEAIADEYPNVMVHTFAYDYTAESPLTDIVPADNVMIQLCTNSCHSHPLGACTDTSATNYKILLEEWSAICDYLAIWDYTTNFFSYNAPFPNFQVLQPNIRLFAENNAKYLFAEGNGTSTNGEFSELRAYLLARLAWNPYMSEEEYCNSMYEFMADYYGPGWEHILAYMEAAAKYMKDSHLGLGPWVEKLYPTVEEKTNYTHKDVPADITLEMLRDYENTDWSPYYEWTCTYQTVDFITEGYEQFALAMEMAETDQQRAHIDKSSIQLDIVTSHTLYPRLTNGKAPLIQVYRNAVNQFVSAGVLEQSEANTLLNGFQKHISAVMTQELKDFNRALAEKMVMYKVFSLGAAKSISADVLDELNYLGVPTGYPEWLGQ